VKVRRSKVWGADSVPSVFSDLPRCPTDRYVPFHAFGSPSRKLYFLARVRISWTTFLWLSFTCDVISGAEARHRHFSFGLGVWMYQSTSSHHITAHHSSPNSLQQTTSLSPRHNNVPNQIPEPIRLWKFQMQNSNQYDIRIKGQKENGASSHQFPPPTSRDQPFMRMNVPHAPSTCISW
jgi:hypothetical protein